MGNKLIDYLMIDHDTAYHNALQAFKGHNLRELEQALHILYNKGYEDGVKATNVDCGIVWEERIDAIKKDIEEHTGYIPILDSYGNGLGHKEIKLSADKIISIIDKHCGGDADE